MSAEFPKPVPPPQVEITPGVDKAEVLSTAISRVDERFGGLSDDAFVLIKRENPSEVSVTLSDRRYHTQINLSETLHLPDDIALKTETGSVTTSSMGALRKLLKQ